jgi:hypothetical protein
LTIRKKESLFKPFDAGPKPRGASISLRFHLKSHA